MAKCLHCKNELFYKSIMAKNISVFGRGLTETFYGAGRLVLSPWEWDVWCHHCKKTMRLAIRDVALYFCCPVVYLLPAPILLSGMSKLLSSGSVWLDVSGFVGVFVVYPLGLLWVMKHIWWKQLVQLRWPKASSAAKPANPRVQLFLLNAAIIVMGCVIVLLWARRIFRLFNS